MNSYEEEILVKTSNYLREGIHRKGCEHYLQCPRNCCSENLNLETSIAWEIAVLIGLEVKDDDRRLDAYETIEDILFRHCNSSRSLSILHEISYLLTVLPITVKLSSRARGWRDLRHLTMENENG